jgi:putative component of toxin-antitoxin plasmid stabilization module
VGEIQTENLLIRKISFYKDYFLDFYEVQSQQTKTKIKFCLSMLEQQEKVPTKFVKHITNGEGLYELRIRVGSNQFRILFFFEEGDLISGGDIVILLNAFVKKKDGDLDKAVKFALKLKEEYFSKK